MNEQTDALESPGLQKLIDDLKAAQQLWKDYLREHPDDYDLDEPLGEASEQAQRALLRYPCRHASEVRMKARFYLFNEDSREFMSEREEIKLFLRSLIVVERT
ncbi:hypothetical protein [Rhizobium sp. Leaf453]|uniref:hypothetical protein n=1 Tax=Rhizobium sp. Leaf453 TaxID=1736380 RepID=UPI000713A207|nr:hypothetical protein [Rhizobium sp. Leaf453]KQT96976.1 hypothetical protein ASG68_08445 [Rhizobium sp. Leaf453]